SSGASIHMIDENKNKFFEVGSADITLTGKGFSIVGEINGEPKDIFVSVANVPTLPFTPGKYFEIQNGRDIYRCYPEDGRLAMKFINMLKIFAELREER
ncbi:MAG: hypothetical protein IJP10_04645, partial [Clostridia bacterium]|nr:hypothetical protein [Clostridia bacterium]